MLKKVNTLYKLCLQIPQEVERKIYYIRNNREEKELGNLRYQDKRWRGGLMNTLTCVFVLKYL